MFLNYYNLLQLFSLLITFFYLYFIMIYQNLFAIFSIIIKIIKNFILLLGKKDLNLKILILKFFKMIIKSLHLMCIKIQDIFLFNVLFLIFLIKLLKIIKHMIIIILNTNLKNYLLFINYF